MAKRRKIDNCHVIFAKFVYQIPRHLKKQRCNEAEVASALASSSGKRFGVKQLSNLSVFSHNTEVLKNRTAYLL